MKKPLIISILFLLHNSYFSQDVLDTLFFVDGKVEAVQLTGLTEKTVQYNFYGEGIPIETSKARIAKIKTRGGRVIVFENTVKKKTVFSAADWENVEITGIESEVTGLIRVGNVSGKAEGATGFSSLEKMQSRAMTKMKMQSAFLGCDVVFILNQTNTAKKTGMYYSSRSASSTLSGTAYSVLLVDPITIINGTYKLMGIYRLKPNEFQLKTIPTYNYTNTIEIDRNNFFLDEDYYSIYFDSKIPDSKNKMSLLKVTDNELVFLVIDRSRQSKIKYYNLYFVKSN